MKTEQEIFWQGEFGDAYIERNNSVEIVASNTHFFSRATASISERPLTVIEFGSNIGLNLRALRNLYPTIETTAVEINSEAATSSELKEVANQIHNTSIFDYGPGKLFDLVIIKGVLIHLNPERLADAYQTLYKATGKYLLVAEYYNPSPVGISYRGHHDKLFKRDFAGEILDRFPNLELIDYGFNYKRDPKFPMDDITWKFWISLIEIQNFRWTT